MTTGAMQALLEELLKLEKGTSDYCLFARVIEQLEEKLKKEAV